MIPYLQRTSRGSPRRIWRTLRRGGPFDHLFAAIEPGRRKSRAMRLGVRLRETSFSYLLLDIEALAAGLSDATLLQLIDFLLRQFPCLSHHQSLYQVNLSHPLDVGLGVVAGRTLRGNEASRLLARRGFS